MEHPASAPPDVAQLRYADISQLQANPDPQLARFITMAASRTMLGQGGPIFQGGQYQASHIPYGQIVNTFEPNQIESPLVDQSPQVNASAHDTPIVQLQGQNNLPTSNAIPASGILPMSRPMHALDYSSSTRRRALQRSITSGPGPQRFTPANTQVLTDQLQAGVSPGISDSHISRPSFPGPHGRPVSEGIIPNIATSLKTPRGSGFPSARTLLDDISAAVGPVAKRPRYS